MSKILVRKQETQPPSMMMGGGSGGAIKQENAGYATHSYWHPLSR